MIYRMELTYDETVDTLDVKYINGKIIGCVLPPGLCEMTVNISKTISVLPIEKSKRYN